MLRHELEVEKLVILYSLRGLDRGLTNLWCGFLDVDPKVLSLEIGRDIVDVGDCLK